MYLRKRLTPRGRRRWHLLIQSRRCEWTQTLQRNQIPIRRLDQQQLSTQGKCLRKLSSTKMIRNLRPRHRQQPCEASKVQTLLNTGRTFWSI